MNFVFIGFIFIILVLQLIMWILIRLKNKKDYMRQVDLTLLFSIISLLCSIVCLSTKNIKIAEVVCNLSFLALDGIVFGLFSFTKRFAEYRKNLKIVSGIYITMVVFDAGTIILNIFFRELFSIEFKTLSYNGFYWSVNFAPLIAYHFIINLTAICFTVYMLIWRIKKVPSFYKNRYRIFIYPYTIGAVLSYVSFVFDLPFNLALICYGFLSYIFFHYNVYKADEIIRESTIKKVIKSYPIATCWFDKENNLVYKNNLAEELFTEKLNWSDVQIKLYFTRFMNKNFARNLDIAVSNQTFTVDDKECKYEVIYRKLFDENEFIGSYLNFRDITAETEKNKQNYILANYDSLTGIYKRERFFEVADDQIRNNPDTKWYMICTNIIGFRLINDLFGIKTGDAVLKHQANYIKERAMENEVYGHIVDDKFAILIPEEHYSRDFFKKDMLDIVKVSENDIFHIDYIVGIYESSDVIESAQYMYDKALMAIDNIPEGATDNVVYYNESIMHTYLDDRAVVSDFNYALSNNHFYMYLQPIFNEDKKLIGAEALTRWNKPGNGLMQPESFLYMFEKTGLIYKLDMYIWEKAAQKLQYWKMLGYFELFISINISINDIFYFDVYEYLCSLIEKYSINPKNLKLGIKESVLISDYGKGVSLFKLFKEKGFDIEIDDFGSLYCSLNVLKDVDADYLRINMHNLAKPQTEANETEKIIIQSIVSLAKKLDMLVIGDNIETAEQFEFLKQVGCYLYQGAYFTKALQDKAFDQMYLK